MNRFEEFADNLNNMQVPDGVIAVTIEGPEMNIFTNRPPEVHVNRESFLAALDMEHIERIPRRDEYDKLQTTINGITFFCLERREEHVPAS